MLTITDLIAVISLCATFYSLGYVRGKHDSKTQKYQIILFYKNTMILCSLSIYHMIMQTNPPFESFTTFCMVSCNFT